MNSNTFFSMTPTVNIKRNRFDMSSPYFNGFNAGELVPLGEPIEVYPGDTFSLDINSFIRMTPTVNVPFSNIVCDIYSFFVPNRIVWTHWKEFCGENNNDPWTSDTVYTIPKIIFSASTSNPVGLGSNTIFSHMGLSGMFVKNGNVYNSFANALPIRGYCEIWNQFFRDQNVDYPVLYNKGDTNSTYTTTDVNYSSSAVGAKLLPVNRFHDYFSSGLPQAQFGDPVSIPLNDVGMFKATNTSANQDSFNPALGSSSAGATLSTGTWAAGTGTGVKLNPAIMPTVDQFRLAYLTQQYLWKLGTFGHRYVETIKSFFGVTAPDYLLDMPLLLGHHRFNINISPVVQTSASEDTTFNNETISQPKGGVSGYSATRSDSSLFTHSFVEHGFIHNLICVRTERTYSQVVSKFWRYEHYLDLYNPVFANIGSQPTFTWELIGGFPLSSISSVVDQNTVFNYQEAWSHLRYRNSIIGGIMRQSSYINYWTTADVYASIPTFSAEWLKEGKDNLNRNLVVQGSETVPQFLGNYYFKLIAVRPLPVHSVPGISPYM